MRAQHEFESIRCITYRSLSCCLVSCSCAIGHCWLWRRSRVHAGKSMASSGPQCIRCSLCYTSHSYRIQGCVLPALCLVSYRPSSELWQLPLLGPPHLLAIPSIPPLGAGHRQALLSAPLRCRRRRKRASLSVSSQRTRQTRRSPLPLSLLARRERERYLSELPYGHWMYR